MGFFNPSSWKGGEITKSTLSKCGKCGLFKKCFSPKMQPTGKGTKKILFVAEAPGENEDKQGAQLVGDAGQLLRRSLKEIGEELEDATKTNCVICRPPSNKIDSVYIEACRPNLINTIKALKPNVIIVLGGSAVTSLLADEWKKDIGALSRWVGWRIPLSTYNAWLCPTYHPSYILRKGEDETLVRIFKEHLRQAYKLEKTPPNPMSAKVLQSRVECILNPRQARLRLRELAQKEGTLAFDYETTGLKPEHPDHAIVSCSFCLDGKDTFACMTDEKTLKLISMILQSDKLRKVASNLKFEERWSLEKLGHPVANWWWDTMLGAHVHDNREGVTSIKFQAFVHFGIGDYSSHISPYLKSERAGGFNRVREINPKELLTYNGMDSLLEYEVALVQRRLLGW